MWIGPGFSAKGGAELAVAVSVVVTAGTAKSGVGGWRRIWWLPQEMHVLAGDAIFVNVAGGLVK